jgi:flagellar hook assembly protein FlgD
MKILRSSGLSKLIVAFVAVMMIVPSASAYVVAVAPLVTSHYATPNPYDPTSSVNYGEVRINFYVNVASNAVIDILDRNGNAIPANNTPIAITSAGTYSLNWDGKMNGSLATAGNYAYRIKVTNSYGTSTVTGPITIVYEEESCTTPVITNDYASPNPFNPDDESTAVYYTLNTAAQVTVDIREGTTTVASLGTSSKSAGTNQISWNGSGADNGTYTYRITAHTTSCGDAVETGSVVVDNESGNQSGTAPNITDDYVSPNPFDSDDEDAKITFTVDKDAEITLEILDSGDVIRNIADEVYKLNGTYSFYWNGKDDDGDFVDDGTYTYRIRATNSHGTDTESGTVRVDTSSSNDDDDDDDDDDYDYGDFDVDYGNLIDNIEVDNALFNPEDSERAKLTFDVEEDNVDVTVSIIDTDEDEVRGLVDSREYDESTNNNVYWNGRDTDNDIVDDDIYLFKIEAEKDGEDDEVAYIYLEVDTDDHVIGFPDDEDGSSCAGYSDVSKDNPYCKAIELMKVKGIFTGYSDGTFRLYSSINRAETVKVVLLAIERYEIMSDNGTNLGFWDVVKKAWYMPYLRTAQSHGIIEGYPDGSFRPTSVPNKVELIKMFLEGTGINVPYCNVAPYNDTPATSTTRWYIDYVCFAAEHGLIPADSNGNFNPAEAMTRGDVAMLFYNFYVRGLYSETPYYNSYSY